jgi:hypothetical protein
MTKDEIMQLVVETADSTYNKEYDLSNKTLCEIYANIHNNIEQLIVEVLYQIQDINQINQAKEE